MNQLGVVNWLQIGRCEHSYVLWNKSRAGRVIIDRRCETTRSWVMWTQLGTVNQAQCRRCLFSRTLRGLGWAMWTLLGVVNQVDIHVLWIKLKGGHVIIGCCFGTSWKWTMRTYIGVVNQVQGGCEFSWVFSNKYMVGDVNMIGDLNI